MLFCSVAPVFSSLHSVNCLIVRSDPNPRQSVRVTLIRISDPKPNKPKVLIRKGVMAAAGHLPPIAVVRVNVLGRLGLETR